MSFGIADKGGEPLSSDAVTLPLSQPLLTSNQ